jgi:hypothetical protein
MNLHLRLAQRRRLIAALPPQPPATLIDEFRAMPASLKELAREWLRHLTLPPGLSAARQGRLDAFVLRALRASPETLAALRAEAEITEPG